jgi:ABC-2 type transport system permease protein
MVALFAGLKWRLLTSRIRSATPGRRAAVLLGLGLVMLAAAAIAFGLTMLRTVPAYAVTTASVLLASQLVAWMLTPLIAFGVDETVDPRRFALLPLSRRDMLRGLTVSALIGWLPAVNTIVLLGVAGMISPSWGVLPVALVCMAAHVDPARP